MDSTPDTLRDAPIAEAQPRGKVSVWLLLVFGALTCLSAFLGTLGALSGMSSDAAAEQAANAQVSRMRQLSESEREHIKTEAIAMERKWAPWDLATELPYALTTGAVAVLALLVVLGDSDAKRRLLMIAAIVASVVRVGVGLVGFQVASDALALMTGLMRGHNANMARAGDLVNDMASVMLMGTTVVVVLFWLITGIVAGPRSEEA